MAAKPVLLLACGNPSRGDDALGPLLLEALAEHADPDLVECIVDFQLQIEHSLDLQDRQLVVFIDASVREPSFELTMLTPAPALSHTTHALSPAALLGVYCTLHGEPPPAYLLSIGGRSFELGEALSPAAQANLAQATCFALQLLQGSPAEMAARAASLRFRPVPTNSAEHPATVNLRV